MLRRFFKLLEIDVGALSTIVYSRSSYSKSPIATGEDPRGRVGRGLESYDRFGVSDPEEAEKSSGGCRVIVAEVNRSRVAQGILYEFAEVIMKRSWKYISGGEDR